MKLAVVGMTYARDHGSYDGTAIEVWIGDWVFSVSYGRRR